MKSMHKLKSPLYRERKKSKPVESDWSGQWLLCDVGSALWRRVLFCWRKEIAKIISTENLRTCADIKFHNMSAHRVHTDWAQALASATITFHFFVRIRCLCPHHPALTSQSDWITAFSFARYRLRTRTLRNYTSAGSICGGVRGLESECSFGLTSASTSCSKRQLSMWGFTLRWTTHMRHHDDAFRRRTNECWRRVETKKTKFENREEKNWLPIERNHAAAARATAKKKKIVQQDKSA